MDVARFRTEARTWLAEHRDAAPRDYGAILPPELVNAGRAGQQTLFAAGWTGIHWPEEHGGRGLTPEHTEAWTTECALAEVPPWINMVGVVLTGGSLLAFGTPEQQQTHLRPILEAEQVWCQLFSEPGAGSDLASLSCRAETDDDGWVVTGQKVWRSTRCCREGRRVACSARRRPDRRGTTQVQKNIIGERRLGLPK